MCKFAESFKTHFFHMLVMLFECLQMCIYMHTYHKCCVRMAILFSMIGTTDMSSASFANSRPPSHLAIILHMVNFAGPSTSTVLRHCRCWLLLTNTLLHLLRCIIIAMLMTAAALCKLVFWLTSSARSSCFWQWYMWCVGSRWQWHQQLHGRQVRHVVGH